MASLNFNAAAVAPQQSFEPLPEDWYIVCMTESEMKPTKDSATTGNAYLETVLTVQDGDYKGRKLFYRLNVKNSNPVAQEIAYKQLSAICHATGVIQVEDSRQLHGLPFQVKVVVRKDDSGKYDPTNEVKAIKGLQDAAAPAMPPTGFAAPAAPMPTPMATPTAGGSLPPWMQPKQ
jgi:hypothetical protein